MSKARSTGNIGNIIKTSATCVTVNDGTTDLLIMSGSGRVTIPGNLVVLGGISGSSAESSSYSLSSSFATNANFLDGIDGASFLQTGSFNTFSSSIDTTIKNKLNGDGVISGSVQVDITSTTGYSTFSSSLSSSIGSLSGSVATTTSGLSSSIGSLSSSVATNTSGLAGRITTIEGNYATTGSNIFVGSQVITGSLYITNDMIVQGCSCLQNITASAVSIGTNVVMLNTATPAVRFAGISVQDSGSNAGVTGSIYWDGLCNKWIYSNPSDIGYSGGMLISGPRSSTLGSEAPLTCNYIAKSGGGDHIYDSCIIDDGTTVCINANLKGSGTACFGGVVCVGTNLIVRSAATFCDTVGLFGGSAQLYIGTTSNASDFAVLGWCSTNKSLNIQNQSTGNNPQLIIACDGKVGVAVRDPIVQLHVRTNVASESRPTNLSTSATNSAVYFTTIAGSSAGIAFGQLGTNSNYIQSTYENGSACTPLILNPYSGNVGIGTGNTAPGGALDVVTCSNSTQNFYLRNTSNLDASSRAYFNVVAGNTSLSLLVLAGGGSCGGTYIAGTTGADMYFQQAPGSTVNMIIKSDGKVGIGTSSPAGFLEIKCAQNTYNRIVACFEASYTSGFAFSDLNGGIKYDAGSNVFCIYSTYPNYGGVMVQTGASQRMLITSCGSVNIGTLATGKHNVEIGDIKDGPGGFAYCYFLVAQGTWATFACVTNNDTNVVTDITYVNNNDYNRSGVFVARWAYNDTCAALYIRSCLWNDSQNIGSFGLRNNGGALQICITGGTNGYRVQARTQGARATG